MIRAGAARRMGVWTLGLSLLATGPTMPQSPTAAPTAEAVPAWSAPSSATPNPAAPKPSTPSLAAPAPGTTPLAPSPTPNPAAPVPSPSPSDVESDGQVVELQTRPALFIEAKAKREEVYNAIMASLEKLRAAAQTEGLAPEGHPLAVFLAADDDGFTYRAMLPLGAPADPKTAPVMKTPLAEGMKLGQTPVGKAMKFEYRGEYDDIDSTYDAITAYLDEKGVDAQDVFLEEYLNTPTGSDDPNLAVDIYVLIR